MGDERTEAGTGLEGSLRDLVLDERIGPLVPPNWWRCFRVGGISGRYEGSQTEPGTSQRIHLRIDVDLRHPESPVLDAVSADVFQHFRLNWLGYVHEWDVYRYSWIAEDVDTTWAPCSATITGTARRWDTAATHPLEVTVEWSYGAVTRATCRLTVAGGAEVYTCQRRGHGFRTLDLEVDVAQSVDDEPIEPDYEVTWHANRPSGITARALTVERAFAEAGVEVTVNPVGDRTIIDDSATQFTAWSDEELHDAMESFYSRYPGSWPAWRMWFLVAGSYDSAGTGGIMFDYWGPGEPPERQGCAIFRNHWWWNDLIAGAPASQAQAEAHRKWLHTFVHEIGHGFNYVHSWNKSSPDDLSWMNYDWRYDDRNGPNSYFADFLFRFTDTELLHLRHGNRAAVIPGGESWGTGNHADDGSVGALEIVGEAPLEVIVRSKPVFDFLEPVRLEVRVRNTSPLEIPIDGRLSAAAGSVQWVIRKPDGRTILHHPPLCHLGAPAEHVLRPLVAGVQEGEDRLSAETLLGFGADGLYFDEPGTYLVRAIYHGPGGITLPSAVHRFRVANPRTRRDEDLAADLFRRDEGLTLSLGGSASPHLAKAMDHLRAAADELEGTAAGAQVAAAIATTFVRQRFRVNDDAKLVRARAAAPATALELIDTALETQAKTEDALTPIAQHELHRERAKVMAETGKKTQARKDLQTLGRALARRGVNPPVLEDLKAFAQSL